VSVVHKCDTCKAKTKPQPLTGLDCQIADTFPDHWGVYINRAKGRVYTVCPDCWGWWHK